MTVEIKAESDIYEKEIEGRKERKYWWKRKKRDKESRINENKNKGRMQIEWVNYCLYIVSGDKYESPPLC